MVHNFLSGDQCDEWVARAEKKKRSWLEVVDLEKSTHDNIAVKMDPRRITQKIKLEEMQAELNGVIVRALHDKVETYYKHTIAWYEQPTLR